MSGDVLRRAADRIEAELICCDVFDRLSDKPGKFWTDDERGEYRRHAICYWGEAARRIVLDTESEDSQ
jgi:hypothetical protein